MYSHEKLAITRRRQTKHNGRKQKKTEHMRNMDPIWKWGWPRDTGRV